MGYSLGLPAGRVSCSAMGARDRSDQDWSYEILRVAIQTANCGLIARDSAGRIVFINTTLLGWLGYQREDLLGRGLEVIVPPDLREHARQEREATDEGDLRCRLTVLQRRDSTTFPVIALPNRLAYPDDGPVGTYAIVIDLSSIHTAKRSGPPGVPDLRQQLERIAMEVEMIGLVAGSGAGTAPNLQHELLQGLSRREREVLGRLVSGDRVAAIASHLHISPHTVRNHLKSIYRKVGVRSQVALIRLVRSLSEAPAPRGGSLASDDLERR